MCQFEKILKLLPTASAHSLTSLSQPCLPWCTHFFVSGRKADYDLQVNYRRSRQHHCNTEARRDCRTCGLVQRAAALTSMAHSTG